MKQKINNSTLKKEYFCKKAQKITIDYFYVLFKERKNNTKRRKNNARNKSTKRK